MENATKQKIKKVVDICTNVLIWICVAISLLMTILVFSAQGSEDGVPAVFGKSLITIESPSMKPTYGMNDIVFMTKIDEADKAELKVGDIITYRAPIDINGDGEIGDINTHRIHEIDHKTGLIVTMGDNNTITDNEGDKPYTIHVNDVIGKCTENGKLAGIGGVIKFLRSSLGFFLCIVLPMILFFLYELYRFIALLVSEKQKKVLEKATETEEEIKRRAIEEYIAAQAAAQAATQAAPAEPAAPAEEKKSEEDNA